MPVVTEPYYCPHGARSPCAPHLEKQVGVMSLHLAVLEQLPQQWRRTTKLLCVADVLGNLLQRGSHLVFAT